MFALDHKQQTPITFNQLKPYIKFNKYIVLLCGYFIFLCYFWQNKFFPNMDTLNWTSLLIPAFLLGALISAIIPLFLMSIGYAWYHWVSDDEILFRKIIIYKNHWLPYDRILKKWHGAALLFH